ncbi:MAG: hypothetical protein E6J15_10360, partial [Chloroflexi bacterium]
MARSSRDGWPTRNRGLGDVRHEADHRDLARALADTAGPGRRSTAAAPDGGARRGRSVPDHAGHVRGAQAHPRRTKVTLDDLPVVRAVPSVTASQMAEVDRITIEEFNIPVDVLMENAGRQTAASARAFLGGTVADKRVIGLVGSGNNGGDTAAALRHLINWGARVGAEVAAPQERVRETTRTQIGRLLLATYSRIAVVHEAWQEGPGDLEADLIIDGLLGYSARGAPRGPVADLIDAANGSEVPIL